MIVTLAIVGLFVVSFATVRAALRADLHTPQDLPADVRAEVDAVWTAFNEVFASRRQCVDDVTLMLVDRVEGGDARYVIDDATIEVDIPTSPRRFRESVAHELAHHVEHTCDAFGELQSELEEVLDPSDGWFNGATWEATPSEIYAEAVVELINGERVRHVDTVTVPPELITRIQDWANN